MSLQRFRIFSTTFSWEANGFYVHTACSRKKLVGNAKLEHHGTSLHHVDGIRKQKFIFWYIICSNECSIHPNNLRR